jgi:two-component system CheB/CheR fusion protein
LMVLFEEVIAEQKAVAKKNPKRKPVAETYVDELEKDLEHTRENLQATVEELQTSNEELRSMNEEYQSTNEELQSANEELETSREEMQSLNEELTTVNTELHDKIDDLTKAQRDMELFLNSLEIPTVYLDPSMKILRFTVQAKKVVNLVEHDVGRPLSHISTNLKGSSIVDEVKEVIRSLTPTERMVESLDGTSYLMRVLPYKSRDNRLEGIVVSFVNLDGLRANKS